MFSKRDKVGQKAIVYVMLCNCKVSLHSWKVKISRDSIGYSRRELSSRNSKFLF